jgi:deoxyribonuclease V
LTEEGAVDPAEREFFRDVLAGRKCRRPPSRLKRICCVDVAYSGADAFSAAVLLEGGAVAETSFYRGRPTFPYVPGLFYLREGPFAVKAVRGLRSRPQVVCFDGHGVAHPSRAGLATVCGRVLGLPSIGIAKSPLAGFAVKGGRVSIISLGGRTVGYVTGIGSGRRYWSPGFSVTLAQLRSIISSHGEVCLKGMVEADAAARALAVSSRS